MDRDLQVGIRHDGWSWYLSGGEGKRGGEERLRWWAAELPRGKRIPRYYYPSRLGSDISADRFHQENRSLRFALPSRRKASSIAIGEQSTNQKGRKAKA